MIDHRVADSSGIEGPRVRHVMELFLSVDEVAIRGRFALSGL